jgi:hypothetical protein
VFLDVSIVLKKLIFLATVCIYTTSLSEGDACICKCDHILIREAEFIYTRSTQIETINILLVNQNCV